jgi:hypothetical protein
VLEVAAELPRLVELLRYDGKGRRRRASAKGRGRRGDSGWVDADKGHVKYYIHAHIFRSF